MEMYCFSTTQLFEYPRKLRETRHISLVTVKTLIGDTVITQPKT